MGISGFFGRRNIMRLRVIVKAPDEIYAGTVMPFKVTIFNDKRFMPSFLIRVRVEDSEIIFPVVDKRSMTTGLAGISFPLRGKHTIDSIHVSSVFPFNFFTRFRRIDSTLDVIVFPAARKCSVQSLFAVEKTSKGDRTFDRAGFEAEILSIRNYRYGDPQKYIHWKASARTGQLKTKELSSLLHRPLIIDFDEVPIRDVEEKISCITYVIVKSYRLNMPVGIKIGGRTFRHADNRSHMGKDGTGKIAVLRELALYGTEQK
jgi:uncharacterized protein (DUF58 family)